MTPESKKASSLTQNMPLTLASRLRNIAPTVIGMAVVVSVGGLIAAGCGGGNKQPTAAPTASASGRASVVLQVKWPDAKSDASRVIPTNAVLLRVTLTSLDGAGNTSQDIKSVFRPTSTLTFDNIPYGRYSIKADAYDTVNPLPGDKALTTTPDVTFELNSNNAGNGTYTVDLKFPLESGGIQFSPAERTGAPLEVTVGTARPAVDVTASLPSALQGSPNVPFVQGTVLALTNSDPTKLDLFAKAPSGAQDVNLLPPADFSFSVVDPNGIADLPFMVTGTHSTFVKGNPTPAEIKLDTTLGQQIKSGKFLVNVLPGIAVDSQPVVPTDGLDQGETATFTVALRGANAQFRNQPGEQFDPTNLAFTVVNDAGETISGSVSVPDAVYVGATDTTIYNCVFAAPVRADGATRKYTISVASADTSRVATVFKDVTVKAAAVNISPPVSILAIGETKTVIVDVTGVKNPAVTLTPPSPLFGILSAPQPVAGNPNQFQFTYTAPNRVVAPFDVRVNVTKSISRTVTFSVPSGNLKGTIL